MKRHTQVTLRECGCGPSCINRKRKVERESSRDAEEQSNCAALLPCHRRRSEPSLTSGTAVTAEAPVIDILSAVFFTSSYIREPTGAHARTYTIYVTQKRTCMRIHYLHNIPVLKPSPYLPHSCAHFLSFPNTHKNTLSLSSVTVIHQMVLHPLSQFPHMEPTRHTPFLSHLMQSQIRCGPTCIHRRITVAHRSPAAMKNNDSFFNSIWSALCVALYYPTTKYQWGNIMPLRRKLRKRKVLVVKREPNGDKADAWGNSSKVPGESLSPWV